MRKYHHLRLWLHLWQGQPPHKAKAKNRSMTCSSWFEQLHRRCLFVRSLLLRISCLSFRVIFLCLVSSILSLRAGYDWWKCGWWFDSFSPFQFCWSGKSWGTLPLHYFSYTQNSMNWMKRLVGQYWHVHLWEEKQANLVQKWWAEEDSDDAGNVRRIIELFRQERALVTIFPVENCIGFRRFSFDNIEDCIHLSDRSKQVG